MKEQQDQLERQKAAILNDQSLIAGVGGIHVLTGVQCSFWKRSCGH